MTQFEDLNIDFFEARTFWPQNADMKIRNFYMAIILELLNKPNVSLQGTQITLVGCVRKCNAFVDMALV